MRRPDSVTRAFIPGLAGPGAVARDRGERIRKEILDSRGKIRIDQEAGFGPPRREIPAIRATGRKDPLRISGVVSRGGNFP